MQLFRLIKRIVLATVILLLMCTAVFAGTVEATDGLQGNECRVEADEIIVEDFYFFCNTLVINGFVNGDIVGLASEVTIARDGRVTGDIWILGGNLTVEGQVEDDIHFAGVDLDVTGLARFSDSRSDIIAVGISMEVASNVVVPGDVIFNGYQAILNGTINGNVDFQGQTLAINNTIGGQVDAVVGDQDSNRPLTTFPLVYSVEFQNPGLRFGDEGFINQALNYEAPQRVANTSSVVDGRVRYTQSTQTSIIEAQQSETFLQIAGNYILSTVRDIATLGLIGLLTLNLFPAVVKEPSYRVQTKVISAFSWGLTTSLLAVPVALVLLLSSLVILAVVFIITLSELTVMMSVLLLVVNLGFFGIFFFLLIFMGRVITSFVVGVLLVRRLQQFWKRSIGEPPEAFGELWFSLFFGITVIASVVNLPLGSFVSTLQFIVTGIVACAGFGALFMYLRDIWYVQNSVRVSGRHVPPPPEDTGADLDMPLGTENLPPGFKGFD